MAETYNNDLINLMKLADVGNAKAQLELGYHYLINNDFEKAFEMFSKAADQNNPFAQTMLAVYYCAKEDFSQAYELFSKAANHGDTIALIMLGFFSYDGEYINKNYDKAFELFDKAESQNTTITKYLVGENYYKGKGVDNNLAQAIERLINIPKQGGGFFLNFFNYIDEDKGEQFEQEQKSEKLVNNKSTVVIIKPINQKMEKKTIKLACYDILPTDPMLTKRINYVDELLNILSSGKISDRCRVYSDIAVEGEQEFITKKTHNDFGLFCTFLHLKEGGAVLISKALMSEEEISLEELAATEENNTEGHLKDYTYFLFTNKVLIIRSTRGIPASDISIYLNWLLKKSFKKYSGKNTVFTLKHRLKKTFDPKLVGCIELGNSIKIGEKRTVDTIVRPVLKGLEQFLKAQGYDGIPAGKVIDASVILKIIKPSQKDKDKNTKALQSILDILKNDEAIIR